MDVIGEDYLNRTVALDLLAAIDSTRASINFLFPPDILNNPLASLRRAFLSPLNKHVDEFNDEVLRILPEQERTSILVHT